MAEENSDINIRLNIKPGEDDVGQIDKAVADVGAEAEKSADHAARLLKVIAELIDKLNGMDSDAAKKLRDDLEQLAKVVNTLDTARLEHLDSILESLAATGSKLTGKGVEDVSKKLTEATTEAKAFKDSFSNDAGVKVNVTFDAADSMEDLRQKIDITEEANDLIADLKNVRRELSNLEEGGFRNLDKVSKPLEDIIEQFKNLDPKNVQKGAESFERLTKAISSLSEKDRGMLKSFDFSKIDRQVSGITDKIKSTTKETDKVGFIADLLQGKFEAVGNRIIDLIQKTKTWQKAVAAVGNVKATAAIAAISAAVAIAVRRVQEYIERLAAERRKLIEARYEGIKQQSETAEDIYRRGNRIRTRNTREYEMERDETLARSMGWMKSNNSAIELERQRKLLTATDPAERERINREADRQISDNDYQSSKWNIGVAEDKLNRKIEDQKAQIEALEKTINKFRQAEESNGKYLSSIMGDISKDGRLKTYVQDLMTKYGFGNYEDILKSTEATNELLSKRRELQEELKDLEINLKETEASRTTLVTNPRAELEQDRTTELERRKAEDAERQRGYNLANSERAYEVSERNRRNKEADEEADRAYQDQMRTFAERLKALNEVLDKRVAEREESQKKLDALMKKYEGKGEQAWSAEDKSERRKAEDAIERLAGTIRSLRTEARNAQRAGDTEGVQFARGRREERREREEADRALLNQWRERMGGPAATASVAYDEAQIRKEQLAESTKRQNDLIESVRQRLIAEKRISANEKVDFENLKYNKLMTDAEREAYDNNRSDIRRDTANVKTAASRVAEVEADRADRFAEFRDNAMKQSNRLTAMGLGGGAVVGDFGRATADNTRRANELLKDILGALKADGGTESGKKLVDSLSSWSM